jgi:hypothetical protein
VSASIGGIPCALATSTCQCSFGGTITVVSPAQAFASAT